MTVTLKAIEGIALGLSRAVISLKKTQSQFFQTISEDQCCQRCTEAPTTGSARPATALDAYLGGAKSTHHFLLRFDELLHLLPDERLLRCMSLCYHSCTPQLLLTPSKTSLAFLLHRLHVPAHKQGARWRGTNPTCSPNACNCCCRLGPELRVFSICRTPCGVSTKAIRWVWGRRGSWDTINQPIRGRSSFPQSFPG